VVVLPWIGAARWLEVDYWDGGREVLILLDRASKSMRRTYLG
jgi:hypothetical protein